MRTALVVGLLMLPGTASGQWTVDTTVDAMTDDTLVTAKVVNDEGFSLSIYHMAGQSPETDVWMLFNLPSDNTDVLDSEELPMFRIDKNEPRKLSAVLFIQEEMKRLSRQLDVEGAEMFLIKMEPKWVNWALGAPAREEILNGETMLFRYWLFTGGFKDTTFTLEGAKEALGSVMGWRAAHQ